MFTMLVHLVVQWTINVAVSAVSFTASTAPQGINGFPPYTNCSTPNHHASTMLTQLIWSLHTTTYYPIRKIHFVFIGGWCHEVIR